MGCVVAIVGGVALDGTLRQYFTKLQLLSLKMRLEIVSSYVIKAGLLNIILIPFLSSKMQENIDNFKSKMKFP